MNFSVTYVYSIRDVPALVTSERSPSALFGTCVLLSPPSLDKSKITRVYFLLHFLFFSEPIQGEFLEEPRRRLLVDRNLLSAQKKKPLVANFRTSRISFYYRGVEALKLFTESWRKVAQKVGAQERKNEKKMRRREKSIAKKKEQRKKKKGGNRRKMNNPRNTRQQIFGIDEKF